MIVDAFTETLEIGLESPGQVVVSAIHLILSRLAFLGSSCLLLKGSFNAAYDPHLRVRVAKWSRDWGIFGTRPRCARSVPTPPIWDLTNIQVEQTSSCVS